LRDACRVKINRKIVELSSTSSLSSSSSSSSATRAWALDNAAGLGHCPNLKNIPTWSNFGGVLKA
jgi:hypothetical protein